MTNIKIIKKQDGYSYTYDFINSEKKLLHITKSGFTTPESALEAAKKSYDYRMRQMKQVKSPIKVPKPKHIKEKKEKPKKEKIVSSLDVTPAGYKILTAAVYGTVALTLVVGGIKLINEIKEKFPDQPPRDITDVVPIRREIITPSDCDFSNLYIVVRVADPQASGVASVTCDLLTRLGVENELISGDSDLSSKISSAVSSNPNSNIVLLNLESGLENSSNNKTIIMGDCSNNRTYSSDILAFCINTSLKEYNLDPIIHSGQSTGEGWRLCSYIESELQSSTLINSVSQLTIDLPSIVADDDITRNDAAASIVEGIMRWTALDVTERYANIYYTAGYGETAQSIGDKYGLSGIVLEENSDVNIYRGVTVGDSLLIGIIPSVAQDNVTAYIPYTTSDINSIEPTIIEYTVQSGDTITAIANSYGVNIDNIVIPSGDPNNIHVGETLYITTYNLYETHKKTNLTEIQTQNQL